MDAELRLNPTSNLNSAIRTLQLLCQNYGVTVTVTLSYEKSEPSLATARRT